MRNTETSSIVKAGEEQHVEDLLVEFSVFFAKHRFDFGYDLILDIILKFQ